MAKQEDFDFREDLARAVANSASEPVTITMVSRHRYEIRSPNHAIVAESMVEVFPPSGKQSFFLISQISNVDIDTRRRK